MVFDKTLAEIVDENYVYARALNFLGISFFENPNKELGQICLERGLDRSMVIKSFYQFDGCTRLSFEELKSYPLELLLEYLRHAHHLFIKDKLPFITYLAKSCDENQELQKVLPEFVEDFIRHIYEEEDTVFKYVKTLNDVSKRKVANPISALVPFHKFSLKDEYYHHKDDDELEGIRSLIASITPDTLKQQVLIKEIKAFDREILYHAAIENEIFYPQALEAEGKVFEQLKIISSQN